MLHLLFWFSGKKTLRSPMCEITERKFAHYFVILQFYEITSIIDVWKHLIKLSDCIIGEILRASIFPFFCWLIDTFFFVVKSHYLVKIGG